jgi:hypothetical protein
MIIGSGLEIKKAAAHNARGRVTLLSYGRSPALSKFVHCRKKVVVAVLVLPLSQDSLALQAFWIRSCTGSRLVLQMSRRGFFRSHLDQSATPVLAEDFS